MLLSRTLDIARNFLIDSSLLHSELLHSFLPSPETPLMSPVAVFRPFINSNLYSIWCELYVLMGIFLHH